MSAEVKDPTYAEVPVDDPRIRYAVQNMQRQGYSKDMMVKIIGAPSEIIERHLRALDP